MQALSDNESASFEQLSSIAVRQLESSFPNLLPSVIQSISLAEADCEIERDDSIAADDVIFNNVRAVEAQLRESARITRSNRVILKRDDKID